MHPSPNISRSRPTVIRCKAKHELTKRGLQEEFQVVKEKFFCPTGSTAIVISDLRQQRQWMTQKDIIFRVKSKFFLKRSFGNLVREIFPSPNSVPSLRP